MLCKSDLFYFTSLKVYLHTNLGHEIRPSLDIKSELIHSFVRHFLISSYVPDSHSAPGISSEGDISHPVSVKSRGTACFVNPNKGKKGGVANGRWPIGAVRWMVENALRVRRLGPMVGSVCVFPPKGQHKDF